MGSTVNIVSWTFIVDWGFYYCLPGTELIKSAHKDSHVEGVSLVGNRCSRLSRSSDWRARRYDLLVYDGEMRILLRQQQQPSEANVYGWLTNAIMFGRWTRTHTCSRATCRQAALTSAGTSAGIAEVKRIERWMRRKDIETVKCSCIRKSEHYVHIARGFDLLVVGLPATVKSAKGVVELSSAHCVVCPQCRLPTVSSAHCVVCPVPHVRFAGRSATDRLLTVFECKE
jgi:hypothetical protein